MHYKLVSLFLWCDVKYVIKHGAVGTLASSTNPLNKADSTTAEHMNVSKWNMQYRPYNDRVVQ